MIIVRDSLLQICVDPNLNGDWERRRGLVFGLPDQIVDKLWFVDEAGSDPFLEGPTLGTTAVQVDSVAIVLDLYKFRARDSV